ncbi:MAG: twin-arginine translocase TatA/TatE family subunit [Alphaproteobacteria bacterium]|nr:twin-arginine translocase TatA/TatE family subunit [Rickettsiales bacterium]
MFGVGQLVLVALVVFILFGAGKLPSVMGELGKGIKKFKDNLQDGNENNCDNVQITSLKSKKVTNKSVKRNKSNIVKSKSATKRSKDSVVKSKIEQV